MQRCRPDGYRITEVEPPRRLWFGEIPSLDGSHGYVLESVDGGTRISHMLSAEPSIIPYLVWTVALRRSRDAISERILDNLELLVTGTIAHPYRPRLGVRIIKRLLGNRSAKVAPPRVSTVRGPGSATGAADSGPPAARRE